MTSQRAAEVLLTPKNVAAQLQAPEKTLAAWRSNGTGPRFIRVGRHVRYAQTDVDVWVAAQTRGGTHP